VRRADHLYRGDLWMSVCFECCVFSGRFLGNRLVNCTEESYGCVSIVSVVCCQFEVCSTG